MWDRIWELRVSIFSSPAMWPQQISSPLWVSVFWPMYWQGWAQGPCQVLWFSELWCCYGVGPFFATYDLSQSLPCYQGLGHLLGNSGTLNPLSSPRNLGKCPSQRANWTSIISPNYNILKGGLPGEKGQPAINIKQRLTSLGPELWVPNNQYCPKGESFNWFHGLWLRSLYLWAFSPGLAASVQSGLCSVNSEAFSCTGWSPLRILWRTPTVQPDTHSGKASLLILSCQQDTRSVLSGAGHPIP